MINELALHFILFISSTLVQIPRLIDTKILMLYDNNIITVIVLLH